ncbi:MAG: mechanosensitive ion channel [Planctomycetes bacterium]|nr:mechanosensitive ion channel [Planctomycetota bacterium]
MDLHTRIGNLLSDERLLINLIGAHVLLGAVLLVSAILRKLLIHGGDHVARWTGLRWLDGISKEATRRVRALLFWATLCVMVAVVAGAVIYHIAGRDMRVDVRTWYAQLTAKEILGFGIILGELVLLALGMVMAFRLVRRGRATLETHALTHLPQPTPELPPKPDDHAAFDQKKAHEDTVRRWFFLLERFLLMAVFLTGIWIAGHIVQLQDLVDRTVGFLLRMVAIAMVARLLTLACRTILHALTGLGNRHLAEGKLQRYWEHFTRLIPFTERCFEAAVYITAASMIVRLLDFSAVLADRVVLCIGIFFVTRVLIELFTVLLNEAFGMYQEDRPLDQKGQTLVPLLQSISQYVVYFGAGVTMLGTLGIETGPILAGAGILGLAGGLGAQSLVTDVVSGFFILFENQYLVGDVVQVGDAVGRVEAVSIRHTQIRDGNGKLTIIPNGQIKSVINYSKGYVNAVVDFKMPTSANLEQVMHDMAEAGRLLRQSRREVIGDTVVTGLVDLTPSDMTVRAVTKVMPGTHLAMQNEYRRLLKQVFDRAKEMPAIAA